MKHFVGGLCIGIGAGLTGMCIFAPALPIGLRSVIFGPSVLTTAYGIYFIA